MAKPDEEKLDGLEINSIGKLYDGPWDKKYWSSSRGKDRYPYPVGYRAVRTQNGITYKMEILEGLKGPSFVINSTNGQSCSGQTPDIVWESFQKKGCTRLKLWHGKRFSGKIDGVEFFGFKNPFVQRLLRELVANISGTAEPSLLSSSFCNGADRTKHHTQCTESFRESCTNPDMLPHLAQAQVTARSRKHKIINVKSIIEDSPKRLRSRDQKHNVDASISRQRSQRNHNNRNNSSASSASNEEYGICNNLGVMLESVNLETVPEEGNKSFSGEVSLCFNSFDSSDHLRDEDLLRQEESKFTGSKDFIATEEAGNLFEDKAPLDRSKITEAQGFSPSKPVEKVGEALVLNDPQMINDVDLYAPDTLDPPLDISNFPPDSPKESPYNVKDELTAANMVICEDLVTKSESHTEEEIVTSTANAHSEKNDSDSVGQDIAKSMMTVLLPRALPLLNTFSRKKKTATNLSDISLCTMRNMEENNKTYLSRDVASPVAAGVLTDNLHEERPKEKMHILSTDLDSAVPSCGDITSIAPDSFEDDQCENPVSNQLPPLPNVAEADQVSFGQNTCTPETMGLPVNVDACQGSSVCYVKICDCKISSCREVHLAWDEGPQKGVNLISDSTLGCSSLSKLDMCVNSDENLCIEIHSEQKGNKALPGRTEATISTTNANLMGVESFVQIPQTEISVKTGGAGSDNMPFAQIPDIANSTRQCNTPPLSESIICRNFRDACAPETCTSNKTLLTSDNYQVNSGQSPINRGSYGDKARLDGQPLDFHMENSINSEGAVCNMAPVTSQNQEFVWASNYNDNSNFVDPSISCKEKPHVYGDKEMLRPHDLVEFDGSVSWLQDNGANLCDDMTENKEVKDGSNSNTQTNIKRNNELEGVLELVGCYVHPMPISLVLLSTKGTEVYICVLCGLYNDKDRTLFLYKAAINGKGAGNPSFIGHASIILPAARDAFGREIALDSPGLQFTPDGQCLVLLNSIKAPYCREGNIHCPCTECASDCFGKNAVKIVQVRQGYVSVVGKLEVTDSVQCILVCGPSYLVAAEESGRLHLWVMNSTWSTQTEECYLPTSDCIPPCVVEIKRIPKHASQIVGHNGLGEFSLWDISKRIIVSRFSAPSTSVFQFHPVSLFRWQNKDRVPTGPDIDVRINDIMDEAKMWFSGDENHVFLPTEGEDVAILLLVSTVPDPDVQHGYESNGCQLKPVGWWRLALLVKNMVILGNALDPRAAAIGASAGHGIIATCDGLLYMWELSTGTKLGNLHYFKGTGVTCIATDDSSSGALAVAGGGQLRVYLHSRRPFADQGNK